MLILNLNLLKTKNYFAQREQEALAPIWKKTRLFLTIPI